MRTSKIRALIKIVEESNVDEIELSLWGRKIRIRKRISGGNNNHGSDPQVAAPVPDRVSEAISELAPNVKVVSAPVKADNLLEIKSPMVGTFYRAPAPDAKPYIEIGEKINRGQTACIIEAMKIMNEIESEYDGRIVEVLAQNAQPVQFGQPLFVIEPV